MKGLFCFLVVWHYLVLTQILVGQVQPCSVFEHIEPGDQLTYEHYDTKNRLIKRVIQIVASNKIEVGYHTIHFDQITQNTKGSILKQEEMITFCKNNVLYLNPVEKIPSEAFNGVEHLDYEADSKLIALPIQAILNDTLPDFTLSMSFGQQETGSLVDLQFNMTKRHIGQDSSLTMKAQAVLAKPFYFNTTTRTKLLLAKNTYEYAHVEWYDTQKALLLKAEKWNKNGKYLGYSVLSDYRKN